MFFSDKSKQLLIVGDKAVEFDSPYLIKVSSFLQSVKNFFHTTYNFHSYEFKFGQGLSNAEMEELYKIKFSYQTLLFPDTHPAREETHLVHKKNSKNVMISEPTKINNFLFLAELLIDDECAEISDHVTGYHISASILIEAARQMMLSVSERYLYSVNDGSKLYCILNSINAQYFKFTFPLPTIMQFHILKSPQTSQANKQFFEASINFLQNDELTAEIKFCFSLYSKEKLIKTEEKRLNTAVEKAFLPNHVLEMTEV